VLHGCFRGVLRELAGWNPDRIDTWIRSRPVDFSNPYASHDAASWYVVEFLIPTEVRERIGPRLNPLKGELSMLIEQAMAECDIDWTLLRQQLADNLARFVEAQGQ